ncbi:hypothetical protein LINPERHAP1_LOCUS823 [Linum perenne]
MQKLLSRDHGRFMIITSPSLSGPLLSMKMNQLSQFSRGLDCLSCRFSILTHWRCNESVTLLEGRSDWTWLRRRGHGVGMPVCAWRLT